jgi:hypothetical protein
MLPSPPPPAGEPSAPLRPPAPGAELSNEHAAIETTSARKPGATSRIARANTDDLRMWKLEGCNERAREMVPHSTVGTLLGCASFELKALQVQRPGARPQRPV